MANRVTQDEVAVIIELDTTSTPDITVFIDAANSLVTELCSDSGYSDARLAQIELWLSAHFYAIKDPRAKSEKAGSVGQTLQSKVDLALSVTHYGQMAMILDTAGNLAAVNKQAQEGTATPSPGATWLGTDLYDEKES